MNINNGVQADSLHESNKFKSLPHLFISGSYYFITITTFNRYIFNDFQKDVLFDIIKYNNNKKYILLAFVIMPDHLHMILNPKIGLPKIMHRIKGYSSYQINKQFNRQGKIWQKSYFDKIIRDEKDYHNKILYIANNPVKKKLVSIFNNYKWLYIKDLLENEENNERNQTKNY